MTSQWRSIHISSHSRQLSNFVAGAAILYHVIFDNGSHNVLFLPWGIGIIDDFITCLFFCCNWLLIYCNYHLQRKWWDSFPLTVGPRRAFSERSAAERFKVFSIDPRGYGRSPPPERDWPLNFLNRVADDIAATMQISCLLFESSNSTIFYFCFLKSRLDISLNSLLDKSLLDIKFIP